MGHESVRVKDQQRKSSNGDLPLLQYLTLGGTEDMFIYIKVTNCPNIVSGGIPQHTYMDAIKMLKARLVNSFRIRNVFHCYHGFGFSTRKRNM